MSELWHPLDGERICLEWVVVPKTWRARALDVHRGAVGSGSTPAAAVAALERAIDAYVTADRGTR